MGWSTNQKVLAKRQKQKQEKQKKNLQEYQKKQASKWKDQVTQKKFEEKKKKEIQKQKEYNKKMELKQLLHKEEQEMQKINKKKQPFENKKLTQAEILLKQQRRLLGKELSSQSSDSQDENPNRKINNFQVAQNVEEALNMLDLREEKHPQKRFRAAFQEYCQKRQIQLKVQNPQMKRTQRMELMRKQFQKHPDNPFNKVCKAYNEK